MKNLNIRARAPALGVVLASLLLTTTGFAAAAGQVDAESTPSPLAPATEAQDTVSPSVVFLTIKWKGWVWVPRFLDIGFRGWQGPYEANTMCSGYVQSPAGHVVTAAHCVDDENMDYGGSGLIIQAMLDEWVSYGVPGKLVPELYDMLTMNGKVEGEDGGSPPIRTVTVYPTFAGGNVQNSEALQATVVDMVPFTEGDVALLKVEPPGPWPALEVVGEEPAAQTEILAAGYPGSVTNVTDFSLEPSFKDGKVSGTQEVAGVPFTQISAATTQGMSGGPTVDLEGRVVGLVSWGPMYEAQSFNFITETEGLRSLLSRNDVLGELSATDTAYRAGLDAYAAGEYEAAVEQFDAVLAAIPNHRLAQQYRQKALVAPAESADFPVIPVVVGGAIVAVLVAAAAFLLLRRRGGKAAPAWEPGPTPTPPYGAGARSAMRETGPPSPAREFAPPPRQPMARPPTPRESAPPMPTSAAAAVPPADAGPPAPAGKTMFCPNCGKRHPAEAHFCDSCGQPFAAAIAPQGVEHPDQQHSS